MCLLTTLKTKIELSAVQVLDAHHDGNVAIFGLRPVRRDVLVRVDEAWFFKMQALRPLFVHGSDPWCPHAISVSSKHKPYVVRPG